MSRPGHRAVPVITSLRVKNYRALKDLRTRGSAGPIVIELKYREPPILGQPSPLITYHLAVNEDRSGPFVEEEWLRWNRKGRGRPFKFLDFQSGQGEVTS